jgi:hypothetical protein
MIVIVTLLLSNAKARVTSKKTTHGHKQRRCCFDFVNDHDFRMTLVLVPLSDVRMTDGLVVLLLDE